MKQIRLFLRFTILSGAITACQLSGASQCNGQPIVSNVKEERGILSVINLSGAIARTSDKGVTWQVGEPKKLEPPPFWRKTFHSDGNAFQNIKLEKNMIVINKGTKEEFWSINNYHSLILFSKGKQLFGYRGDLYVNSDMVSLDAGQLTGGSEDGSVRPIIIEVTPRTFCQLAYKGNSLDKACQHPFHASMEDHKITGFHAQANGNFFMSTYKDILYLDVAADKWVRIPPPVQWQCSP